MEHLELDCVGLLCPIPIIRLAKALAKYDRILLLSDDPATLSDLQAWARITGNRYQELNRHEFLVTKVTEKHRTAGIYSNINCG